MREHITQGRWELFEINSADWSFDSPFKKNKKRISFRLRRPAGWHQLQRWDGGRQRDLQLPHVQLVTRRRTHTPHSRHTGLHTSSSRPRAQPTDHVSYQHTCVCAGCERRRTTAISIHGTACPTSRSSRGASPPTCSRARSTTTSCGTTTHPPGPSITTVRAGLARGNETHGSIIVPRVEATEDSRSW